MQQLTTFNRRRVSRGFSAIAELLVGMYSELFVENRKCFLALVYLAPRCGRIHWNFTKSFDVRQLQSLGYHAESFA